jgi:tetratricopeptide (TPR) repeat protein
MQKIILLITGLASLVLAQEKTLHQLALEGIDYASTLQYKKAVAVFDRMIAREPENPQGHFLKSAVYFWMFSADMHNEALGEEFKNLSLEAVEVAEKRLDKDEDDIDALFYLGGAYGSLGRYYGLTKSYINAYWYGKKGMNILEDVVERDSSYWDAYLGLGIYHYLADVLPKFVKVLSFILGIDGDRARGIRELNMAVEKGTYTQTEAMFFLGAIYTYRERDYNRAIDIWNRLLKRYPDNPGVLVHLGACYGRMGQCDKAMKVYTKTLETISDSMLIPVSSVYYQMGQVQFRLNRFDEAIGSFEKSVATDSLFSGNRRWTYGWSHYWLGRAYEMIGNTVKARYHYRAAMDDDNERLQRRASENLEEPMDEVDKRLTIARNLSECNDYQNALAMLESVLKKISDAGKNSGNNDKTEQISYDMAEIYYKLGRYYLAINTLNDLLSRPDAKGKRYFYWAHYYRAASYVRIGMKQKALEDYEVASEDDDDFLQDQIRQDKTMLNID